jgi:hypothetical protein
VEQVPQARALAERLLADALPTRWAHTQGVGHKAEQIAHVVGDDAELLVRAAWLHDIGYAPSLVKAGFHPLDGARYLRDVEHADETLCRLVAHHTCAINEAKRRDLGDQLAAEFPPVDGLLIDALTYCDITTSPRGEPVTPFKRLEEIAERYGDGDIVSQSIAESRNSLLAAVRRVTEALNGT